MVEIKEDELLQSLVHVVQKRSKVAKLPEKMKRGCVTYTSRIACAIRFILINIEKSHLFIEV